MPEIPLSRQATGQELTDIIKNVAGEVGFKYYDQFDKEISVSRSFPEHVPQRLRFAMDVTPYLSLRFGKIVPENNYQSLMCETLIGTMHMEPTNFEDEDAKYKLYYDKFVEGLKQHLK